MKNLIIICLFFLPCLVVGQVNQKDSKGRKQGVWNKAYPKSKVLEYQGQFKDDKPVGTFTYYYSNSKKKAVIVHEEGTGRSVATFYHETGGVMSKGIYRNLKKDSIWLNYTPSGRLSSSETYKNDLLDGKVILYYLPEDVSDRSLTVSSVCMYVKGLREGECVEYFLNGGVKVKGAYKNDKKSGVWESYHANGQKMNLIRYKDGIQHGWCYAYNTAGKEIAKLYFYYGKKLEGAELTEKMAQLKALGIDPNQ
jgi:antitoxin component YwqK of YwqJK toxin-antitoxin module